MCFADSSVSVEIEEGDLGNGTVSMHGLQFQFPRYREKGKMPDM